MKTEIDHYICTEHARAGANLKWPGIVFPQKGQIYTMRKVWTIDGFRDNFTQDVFIACLVNEIVNQSVPLRYLGGGYGEPYWPLSVFKLLKPIDIDVDIKVREPA